MSKINLVKKMIREVILESKNIMTASNYCNDNDSDIIHEAEARFGTVNASTFSKAAWIYYTENAKESPEFRGKYDYKESDFKAAAMRYFKQSVEL